MSLRFLILDISFIRFLILLISSDYKIPL